MFKTTLITTLAMAAVLGAGAPAHASPDPSDTTTYSRAVRVSDLDLSNEASARALIQRIRTTATHVCTRASGRVATDPLLWTSRNFRDCVQNASDRAVASVNQPMVTALYTGKPKIEVAGY